jgi:N-carbamoylputrescine amidase
MPGEAAHNGGQSRQSIEDEIQNSQLIIQNCSSQHLLAKRSNLCTLIGMQRKFTIGLIQMACSPDPQENLRRAESRVVAAADEGTEVICLPELFRTQYFCQREEPAFFDLAEPIPGPSTLALGRIAKAKQVVVIAPVFERRAAGVYHNSAAIIDVTGEVAGIYRKMHIPDDPGYYEKFYFTLGDLGFPAFDTRVGRLATLICWDQWYPEAARLAALQGASVLFYPTAIGWHPHEKVQHGEAQRDAWRTIQRSHAIANGVYVAAVNRVGFEKPTEAQGAGLEFWGTSFVSDPFGVVLKEASTNREELVLAEVDLERLEETRRNWPFFRDRRIDAYAGITQRLLDEKAWRKDGSG